MGNAELVYSARARLGLSNRDLASRMGVSLRTAERWVSGASWLGPDQLCLLARLVHPVDPALAKQIAKAGGATLEDLGLVKSATSRLVDSIVCAAAEALDMSPRVVRPAILAAFARARELGLDAGAVEEALTAPVKTPPLPRA